MSLKRLLALVLVLTMVLSLFPASAFADFEDEQPVEQEEVVEEVPAETTEEVGEAEEPAEEETPTEEPAEETPAEETPAEEVPAEETPAEEVPAEEEEEFLVEEEDEELEEVSDEALEAASMIIASVENTEHTASKDFASMADAIAAVGTEDPVYGTLGNTVTVTGEVTEDVNLNKDIVIKGGSAGYISGTVTVAGGNVEFYGVTVTGAINVTGGKLSANGITASQTVTLSGGEFAMTSGALNAPIAINAVGGKLSISGGAVNGVITSTNAVEGNVTGGTFLKLNSSLLADGYVPEGYTGSTAVPSELVNVTIVSGSGTFSAMTVSEDGRTYYNTLENALNAGGYIVLLEGVSSTGYSIGEETVLDLNGHTLGGGVTVTAKATIKDGSITTGPIFVSNAAVVNLGAENELLTVTAPDTALSVSGGATVTLAAGSSLTSTGNVTVYVEDAALTVNGTVEQTVSSDAIRSKNSTLSITKTAKISANAAAIYVEGTVEGTTTVTGGAITGDNGIICDGGTVKVSGGTITGVEVGIVAKNDAADVTISGGTVSSTNEVAVQAYNSATVTISKGTFKSNAGAETTVDKLDDNAAFVISGGIFDKPVDETWCAAGYIPSKVKNGYSVTKGTYVARVANIADYNNTTDLSLFGTAYTDMDEAKNAAKNNDAKVLIVLNATDTVTLTAGDKVNIRTVSAPTATVVVDNNTTSVLNPEVSGSSGDFTYTTYSARLKMFNVTFKDGDVATSTNYNYGDKVTEPENHPATGYHLAKWTYTVGTGDEAVTKAWDFENDTVTGALTLTAVYEGNSFTVTYHANNGIDPETTATQELVYGTKTKLSKNTFTKHGYEFLGWSKSAVATSINYTDEMEVSQVSTGPDVDLYALWEADTFAIAYDGNGNTGGTAPAPEVSPAPVYDKTATLKAIDKKFVKTGYTFAGWATSATATEAAYLNGATLSVDEVNALYDIAAESENNTATLYAVWTKNTYTVNFNANQPNGASGAIEGTMDPQTLTYDTTENLTANAYTLKGWSFKGWAKTAAGTAVDYEDAAEVLNLSTGKAVTLYAVWEQDTFTLAFAKGEMAEGTMEDTVEVTYDQPMTEALPANTFTKTGYSFNGWSAGDTTFKNKATLDAAQVNALYDHRDENNTVTLTAQWKANTITVKFNGNGGSTDTTVKNLTVVYDGDAKALTANSYTYPGHVFQGWATTSDGDVVYTDGQEVTANELAPLGSGTVTLYAVWGEKVAEIDGEFYDSFKAAAEDAIESGETVTLWKVPVAEDSIELKQGETLVITKGKDANDEFTFEDSLRTLVETNGIVTVPANSHENATNDEYTLNFKAVDGVVTLTVSHAVAALTDGTGETTYYYSDEFEAAVTEATGEHASYYEYIEILDMVAYSMPYDDWNGKTLKIKDENSKFTAVTEPAENATYKISQTTGTGDYTVALYVAEVTVHYYDERLNPVQGGDPIADVDGGSETTPYTSLEAAVDAYKALDKGEHARFEASITMLSNGEYTLKNLDDSLTVILNGNKVAVTAPEEGARVIPSTAKVDGVTYTTYKAHTTYTITYKYVDANGNELDSESVKTTRALPVDFTNAANVTLPANNTPALENYSTFNGWTLNDSDAPAIPLTIQTAQLTNDITVTGHFTIDQKTVKFSRNTGVYAEGTEGLDADGVRVEVKVNYNSTVDELAENQLPTKEGYRFIGWYTTQTPSEETKFDFATPITEDITIYAGWEAIDYTITYVLDGGTNHAENPDTYTVDDEITLKNPTKTGYSFKGWYDNADFTGTAISTIPAGSTGEKTLYAKFTANSYKITYNKNAADATGSTATQTVVYDGEAVNVAACGFERVGYQFAGWNTKADGTGETYAVDQSVSNLTANLTLYAQWTANEFTINFDANTGIGTMDSIPATYGAAVVVDEATVKLTNAFTKEGYTFTGWNTDVNADKVNGLAVANKAELTADQVNALYGKAVDGNVTLYAQWRVNTITVKFDKNGAEEQEAMANQRILYTALGETTLTANTYTYAGHEFLGWSTNKDAETADIDDEAFASALNVTSGTVTLYAVWEAKVAEIDGTFYDSFVDAVEAAEEGDVIVLWQNPVADAENLDQFVATETGTVQVKRGSADVGFTIGKIAEQLVVIDKNHPELYVTYKADTGVVTFTVSRYEAKLTNGLDKTEYYKTFEEAYAEYKANRQNYKYIALVNDASFEWKYDEMTDDTKVPVQLNGYEISFTLNPADNSFIVDHTEKDDVTTYFTADNVVSVLFQKQTKVPTAAQGVTEWANDGESFTEYFTAMDKAVDRIAEVEAEYGADGESKRVNSEITVMKETTYTLRTADEKLVVKAGYDLLTVEPMGGYKLYTDKVENPYTYQQSEIFNVTFELDDGKNHRANNITSYTALDDDFTIQDASKTGYTFNGWIVNHTGEAVKKPVLAKGSTGDVVYTASFSINTYTVTFVAGEGAYIDGEESKTVSDEFGAALTVPEASKTGFEFLGWYLTTDNTQTIVDPMPTTIPAKNVSYTAKWSESPIHYTLTFDYGQDIEYQLETNQREWFSVWTNDFTLVTPTRVDGYELAGWMMQIDDGEPEEVAAEYTVTKGSTGNRTFTAIWEGSDQTLTINANGGKVKDPDGNLVSRYTVTVKTGEAIPALPEIEVAKPGYTFKEWKNGATEVMPFGGLTITAVWTANPYDVTFNFEDATLTVGEETKTDSYSYQQNFGTKITDPGVPVKTGYTFAKWLDADGNEVDFENTVVKVPVEGVTYTADWTADSFKIGFNANKGEGRMTAQSVSYDIAATLKENSFTREGYEFSGWNTKADGSGESFTDAQLLTVEQVNALYTGKGKTVTLYAQWDVQLYTVTLKDVFEGQETTTTITADFGTDVSAEVTEFFNQIKVNRSGYTFNGWFNAETAWDQTIPSADTTYEASWTGDQVSVVWLDGTTVLASKTQLNGDKTVAAELSDPSILQRTKTGYALDPEDLWSPAVREYVSGNAAYSLNWKKMHTVSFQVVGVELKSVQVMDGETIDPEVQPDAKDSSSNKQANWLINGEEGNFFTFDVTPVTDDLVLTATWTEPEVRTITVTWVDEDSTVLYQVEDVEVGSEPEYEGEEPVKTGTAEAFYTFDGWSDPETDEDGNITYTATYAEHEHNEVYKRNVALNDSIAMGWYIGSFATDADESKYSVEYTYKGVTNTKDSDLGTRFYIANCAAKEMTEPATVVVKYDGVEIKTLTYTVRDYCEAMLEMEQYSAYWPLMKATLDYGTYAQKNFHWREDDLANRGTDYTDVAGTAIPETLFTRGGNAAGISGSTFKLVTEAETQLVVSFKHNSSANKDNYHFTVDGVDVSASVVDEGGKYVVTISGISAKQLDKVHTVTVTDQDGGVYTFEGSAVSYMYATQNSSVGNLVKAMYNYSLAAKGMLH